MATGVAWLRQISRRGRIATAAVAATVALVVAGGLWSAAWGGGFLDDYRLLPGTEIAGLALGRSTVDDARAQVSEVVNARLDQPLAVTAAGRTWTTTPRELGATSDLPDVLDRAWARTRDAGVVDLARLRLGLAGERRFEVSLDIPDDALGEFVGEVAAHVDRAPLSAGMAWVDGRAHVRDAVDGRRLLRDEAAAAIEAAIADGEETIGLPVEGVTPPLTTQGAAAIAGDVQARVDAALDHVVTVTLEATVREVTARELGATTNAARLLAVHGDGEVDLRVSEDAAHAVVDEVVEPHEVAATDATLTWSRDGGFVSQPGATGLRVDHEAATARLVDALGQGRDRLDLRLDATQPDITEADFDEVLLVRQADREVDLVRNGTVVRTWPVAVGTSGYPTPTGLFTIGAKRFEPTWHNPDPYDWGRNMPAVIGPGPGNPLGLRALNWNRDGVDTLIRFHGTNNERSIGSAASHGCVRMTNPDVITLYDLVDTGTVILSVA